MNYTPDANEMAARWAREHKEQPAGHRSPTWGTLSIWPDIRSMANGLDPLLQSHCHIDIKDSGIIVAYDDNWDAEIFVPNPGWYINFTRDRDEGE